MAGMRAGSDLSASPLDQPRDAPPRFELLRDGASTGIILPGVVLEAQFEIGDGRRLLFATDDSPYEETLHTTLLANDFRMLDALESGEAYTPGVFSEARVTGPDAIEFRFARDEPWTLRVLEQPRREWLRSPFAVVRRPGWLPGKRCYLVLQ